MLLEESFTPLIATEKDLCGDIRAPLKNRQAIEGWGAQNWEDATTPLDQTHPELIFTATMLPDGNWRDIVRLSGKVAVLTNVIMVGELHTRLHISAMHVGAFGYTFPPFEG